MYSLKPNCDCEIQIYLGITPKSPDSGRRWMIILLDPDSEVTQWFYSKQSRGGGYVHAHGRDIPWKRNCFSDRVWVGALQNQYVHLFNESLYRTRAGPSNVFVADVLCRLAERGIIEQMIADEVQAAAMDTGYEWTIMDVESSNVGRDRPVGSVLARLGLINRDPEVEEMNYELYLAVSPESMPSEANWVVILVHPNGQPCAYYSTIGGPSSDPPTFYQAIRYDSNLYSLNQFKERRRVGCIPPVKLPVFEKAFREIVPGPSQFFATRLLYKCVERELVFNPVLEGLVSEAKYSDAELEYFDGGFCHADEEFLSEASVTADVSPLPPSLLAL
ncbi:uncharacterized protein BDV17DRAFT_294616 [Aspergillus undulatus]|uniref:uncharacterized protein n=1 Tax=Aspergillus undulatus TaxID=1810928 RepID=UPI003CCCD8F6